MSLKDLKQQYGSKVICWLSKSGLGNFDICVEEICAENAFGNIILTGLESKQLKFLEQLH